MKLERIDAYRYDLPLNRPLYVRGQMVDRRRGLIIAGYTRSQVTAVGEIAPLTGASQESLEEAEDQLNFLRERLPQITLPDVLTLEKEMLQDILGPFKLLPCVQCGLEMMIWGLIARQKGRSIAQLLSKQPEAVLGVDGLLYGTLEEMLEETGRLLEAGFKSFKMKVGPDVNVAVANVQAVQDHLRGKALLHIDANQAWSYEQAVTFAGAVGLSHVSYIEEPLKDVGEISRFYDETFIPVAIDESLEKQKMREISAISGVDVVVMKPMLIGSLERIFRMMEDAQHLALNIVVSSAYESNVALSVYAQIASGGRHVTAGLDTAKFFRANLTENHVVIHQGGIVVPESTLTLDDLDAEQLIPLSNP